LSERALIEEQYRTTSNLRARIALHTRFSTNPGSWARFVFDGYDFGPRADVLEVGCGDAMIWRENVDRVPIGWVLTVTDLSAGMVEAARAALGERADYSVADVEALPFDDASFDAVIANHMLFHVDDRRRALGEIRRVLRDGGAFAATTVGANHLRELRELAPPSDGQWAKTRGRFPIETVPEELAPYFARVEIERYPDALAVTELEPLLDFLRSRGDVSDDELDRARVHVERAIARDGAFHVTKDSARVFAR
jgi:SAM-dependent methyltransferase